MSNRIRNILRISKDVWITLNKTTSQNKCSIAKPVYFFGNYKLSSFKLGGQYLISALNQFGIKAESGENTGPEKLHDAILVFVKECIPENLEELKTNGNKIIIDIQDNFIHRKGALYPDFIGRDIADYLIFPNQALLDRFLAIKDTISNCIVLYGFADPAITSYFIRTGKQTLDTLRCCYFGFDYNLDIESFKNTGQLLKIERIPLTEFNFTEHVKKLRNFNMHIDIRQNKRDEAYKPLTKVFIAAQCSSNIIIRRSPRVLEVLPDDYPFLVDDKNDPQSIMERAYALYNKNQWNDSLAFMDEVNNRFSFQNHIIKFIEILQKLS